MAETAANALPADLLEILVCPVDHGKVNPDGDYLVCAQCGRAYPVRDGIPVMLIEEAEQRQPAPQPTPDAGSAS